MSPAQFPHKLVAGGQEDDGKQGEKQGCCAGDSPLFEDDAHVLNLPVEKHLLEVSSCHQSCRKIETRVHRALIAHPAMPHPSVIHVVVVHGQ